MVNQFFNKNKPEIVNYLKDPLLLEKGVKMLYKYYAPEIEKYLLKIGCNNFQLDDIIQETFIAAINRIKNNEYREASSLNTYLIGIAKNLWLNDLRKIKNQQNRYSKLATSEQQIDNHVSYSENQIIINEVFSKLGELCKNLLSEFYFFEKKYEELIKEYHFENEQVLRNKKSKCLSTLRKILVEKPDLAALLKEILSESEYGRL